MIAYGIAACLFSIIVGYLGKFQCQSILFIIASLICYGTLITMMIWKPNSSQAYVLYILAGLNGLASAVWDPIGSGMIN